MLKSRLPYDPEEVTDEEPLRASAWEDTCPRSLAGTAELGLELKYLSAAHMFIGLISTAPSLLGDSPPDVPHSECQCHNEVAIVTPLGEWGD